MDEEEPTVGVQDLYAVISPSRGELGRLAQWSASSHKYGFGVDNLRDDNDGTFWQWVELSFSLSSSSLSHLSSSFILPPQPLSTLSFFPHRAVES